MSIFKELQELINSPDALTICEDPELMEEDLKEDQERYLKEHPPLKEEFITVTIPRPEGLEPEETT